jgi:WD40 repeat protein
MPRLERPLDAEDTGNAVLLRFASDLRRLRRDAGGPTYRVLAERAHYSLTALSEAAAGRKLPTLAVTLAYVKACAGDTTEWEKRWHAVAAELAMPPGDEPGPRSGDSPYVGLAAFQAEDADRYFGREKLVDDLVGKLGERRFVAVFGASGAGKSSLLRAGLLPRWPTERGARRIVLFTPGSRPLEECAIALSWLDGGAPGARHSELRDDPRGLHRIVRQLLGGQSGDAELVLVVDQFEEVFTLCRDPDERQRFIRALLAAAGAQNSRCRVVLGIRADFYAHCTDFADLVAALHDGQVIVGPMTSEELRRAITQPAVRSGYTVETALLTELVAQVNGQAGMLPLLSHALLETWRRRRGNTLTLSGFQAAGGIEGALAQTAESAYGQLPSARQKVVKDLMLRLTALGDGTEDTKRRVTRDELDLTDPDLAAVLDCLAQARLVTLDLGSVEIAHEALIRCWPRLHGWLSEDREGLRVHRQLTGAAEQWEALDRDVEALYRGTRLAVARSFAASADRELSPKETRFLQASLTASAAEQAAARRRSRRLHQLVALLSVLLVLAAAATGYAIDAQRTAAHQRNVALSQIAAVRATTLRRTDAALAAQLSLAAYQLAPTDAAKTSLLATFPLPYRQRLTGHTDNVNSVVFSPDGHLLATASHDGTARLWDVTDPVHPAPLSVLSGHTANVNAVAYSPDGRTVATAGWDRTVRLWDVSDPRRPKALAAMPGHTDNVNWVTFSPDGHRLVSTSTDYTARLWDVTAPSAPSLLRVLAGHRDSIATAAFAPDGNTLATGSFDDTVALWDLTAERPPSFIARQPQPVTSLAYSPDGHRLAIAGADKATVLDPRDGRVLGVLSGHAGTVRSVQFSPDGRSIVTSGIDITARVWDVSTSAGWRQVAQLEAQTETVSSVAFSPDGRTLATGSDDDTAVLWKVPSGLPVTFDVDRIAQLLCAAVDTPISKAQWALYFPDVTYRPPC